MTLNEFQAGLPEVLKVADPGRVIEAGCRFLADYLESSGQSYFVLGLSGGLDSATVALWAARAVGEERLRLYRLPYGYVNRGRYLDSSDISSMIDADRVAAMIPGATLTTIDIASVVDALLDSNGVGERLKSGDATRSEILAAENAKARARALVLRSEANRHSALLLGTENRTENLLGYFTIGGDEESDIELLSELFKTEVRQMYLALGGPPSILEKAPSADLHGGQTDEGDFGFSYLEADELLAVAGTMLYPSPQSEISRRVLEIRDRTAFKRQPKPTFGAQAVRRIRTLREVAR